MLIPSNWRTNYTATYEDPDTHKIVTYNVEEGPPGYLQQKQRETRNAPGQRDPNAVV